MPYLKLTNRYWDSEVDTGFGDRMENWFYAYKLNEINDFNYIILADDYKWRELKYLDFPYTESGINVNSDNSVILDDKTHPHKHIHGSKATLPSRAPELYFGRLTRHTHKGDSWKDSTKAKEVADTDWFLDVGMELDSDVISLIKLKDVVLKDKIKELMKDRIGIRIVPRHYDTSLVGSDFLILEKDRKIQQLKEILDGRPKNSKFYISTDVTHNNPSFDTYLPNFRKESCWLSVIYKDYDVVDYRDIISITKIISKDLLKVYDRKILRDVIDLFSLIYSKEFDTLIETEIEFERAIYEGKEFYIFRNTGGWCMIDWSEFIESYRKGIDT